MYHRSGEFGFESLSWDSCHLGVGLHGTEMLLNFHGKAAEDSKEAMHPLSNVHWGCQKPIFNELSHGVHADGMLGGIHFLWGLDGPVQLAETSRNKKERKKRRRKGSQ